MKTSPLRQSFWAITLGAACSVLTVAAQGADPAPAPPVQLSYGVDQIVQLAHAQVSDAVILSYVHNSGNSYRLDADQIIYLRQQNVSDTVINALLSQPKAVAQTAPATPPSANSSYAAPAAPPVVVQSPPANSVYVIPDTQTYNYNRYSYVQPYGNGFYNAYPYPYPVYSYPSVSLSFGFGGGRYWGGGYHGGGHYHGGWHR